jgi:hypothetical protein
MIVKGLNSIGVEDVVFISPALHGTSGVKNPKSG